MIAIVVFFILTGTLVYVQVSKQGLFSNLIMAVLSVVSAMISFNYYELLATKLVTAGLAVGAQGVALLLIFFVSLLLLREIFDHVIRGNMNFVAAIETAGGTVFSVVSSVVMVGMVMIALQMMPIDGGEENSAIILGFNRVAKMETPDKTTTLMPGIDSIVTDGVARLSRFSFSGDRQFSHHHPNILDELYFNRLSLTPGSRQDAANNALAIQHAWLIKNDVFDSISGKKVSAASGTQLLGVRLSLKSGNTTDRPGASDVDNVIRFTMAQIRLVAFDPEDSGSDAMSRYPLGVLKPGAKAVEIIARNKGRLMGRNQNSIDLLFECPDDLNKLPVQYVEFKRSAIANEHLSTSKLLIAESRFDIVACRTAREAHIIKPKTQKNNIVYVKLVIIPGKKQPLKNLSMIPNMALSALLKENNSGLSDYPNGIDTISVFGNSRGTNNEYTNFRVPKGYVLAYFSVKYLKGVPFEKYPKLIDTNGITFTPRGYILSGGMGKKNVSEVIYDCYKETLTPVFHFFQEGTNLRIVHYLYLLPKSATVNGIVNVRTKQGVCSFRDIDAILIPKL